MSGRTGKPGPAFVEPPRQIMRELRRDEALKVLDRCIRGARVDATVDSAPEYILACLGKNGVKLVGEPLK